MSLKISLGRSQRPRAAARILGVVLIQSAAIACFLAACVQAGEAAGTFSIVAFDAATGELGVAVQSRVFGVGPRVAWVRAPFGAIATQANSNETFGPDGLRLMEAGLSAEETLALLLAHDEGRDQRQVGIIDGKGRPANWTGPACSDWAGDSLGAGFSCQGNILAKAEVVAGMARAFSESKGQELAQRLLAALEAAQAAGGDKRGQQSAALLIGRFHPSFPEYSQRYVDIHVEDHAAPIAELRRLYEIYEAQGLVQAHMRFAGWLEADGDSAAAKGERERVGDVLVRALAGNKGDAEMLNSLAWFTATFDIYLPQALEAAKRAAALEPANSNILDTLAEVHFRLGDKEQALAVEGEALKLSPEDAYLKSQIARFKGETP